MALVLTGVALFYVGRTAWRIATPAPNNLQPLATPLAKAPVENAPAGARGELVLTNCMVALERYRSIEAEVTLAGSVETHLIESTGSYRQQGRGDSLMFSMLLQGHVGPTTTRLWQVSDGRFLWTDLAWGAPQAVKRRDVRRINLSKIRREFANVQPQQGGLVPVEPTAASLQPDLTTGFGGLPMLIDSLKANFYFSEPRQMSLRGEPVYAMIGHWRAERQRDLLEEEKPDSEPSEQEAQSPAEMAKVPDLPLRMPHHVMVAVGARDWFPYLLEYRSQSDPLSAAHLTEDQRFYESRQPLLKMSFTHPRFDTPIASAQFDYPAKQAEGWHDSTAQRLALIKSRQELKIARQQASMSSGTRSR